MSYFPVVAESFDAMRMNEYRHFVAQLGSNVDFSNDKWVCDKRIRSTAERNCDVTLYFGLIPERFREVAKYFCTIYLINGAGIAATLSKITSLASFFRFLEERIPNAGLLDISTHTAFEYRLWLDNRGFSDGTKAMKWRDMNMFCRTMCAWNEGIGSNPFTDNPFRYYQRHSYKYIPENIILQLDTAFQDESIPVHVRCVYWILRLIPSRINEVLAMQIDCLKPYNGHFCLFIPTWKQNGGYFAPKMRVIHLENSGIAAELIALISQQQSIAVSGQNSVETSLRGSLFTYRKALVQGKEVRDIGNEFRVARDEHIARYFSYVCKRNNICNDQGQPFVITSHQLRHNGITDRLAAGFTPEQIRFMTAHHGDAMIYKAYNHLDLLPEVIREKQQYVLNEPNDNADQSLMLFAGRILNMEDQLEKRLLKNVRAHRVPGGICSDITGCRCDMFLCLDCKYFVPDATQLDYFLQQSDFWLQKAERFKEFPLIKSNAEKNARLFHGIAEKILNATGGICNG